MDVNNSRYMELALAEAEAAVPLTDYPERVYWGDTHLHTSVSFDAYGFGNRLGAEDALRFAMGEEVTSTTGVKAKLARPLDFLVISDHSDGMGALQRLAEAPRLLLRCYLGSNLSLRSPLLLCI